MGLMVSFRAQVINRRLLIRISEKEKSIRVPNVLQGDGYRRIYRVPVSLVIEIHEEEI